MFIESKTSACAYLRYKFGISKWLINTRSLKMSFLSKLKSFLQPIFGVNRRLKVLEEAFTKKNSALKSQNELLNVGLRLN